MGIKERLTSKLTKKELSLVPSSFDVVGNVLIFSEFPDKLKKKEKIIGEEFLKEFKNVQTICKKTKKYSGKYRTPTLKVIAGKKSKETTYKENGIILKLDVEKVYFSSRLSNERLRVSKLVKPNEEILVMFSGCGVYPIVISKNSAAKEIVGIEKNPIGHKYALENQKINKLKNITFIKGDVRKLVPQLNKKFDRILMPLPKDAENFLDLAFMVSKKGTIIHIYQFLNEVDFEQGKQQVKEICKKHNVSCKILELVKCGQFGPRIYRVSIDFQITKMP